MKILIITAEDEQLALFSNFFSAQDYEVVKVRDGKLAEDIINISHQHIDIILCDVDQPTQHGFDFLVYLQQNNIQIPFLFMTTSENIHNVIHKLQRGTWNYIIKPILNLSTLLVAIEQLSHQQHIITANNVYKQQLTEKHKELTDDHEAGYKIQQQLLPNNNINILDLNFNYFLHPSLYISGDFVDYQQLSDRYAVFYLSDVSGHGVGSAFVTVLLKACIQQYCSEFTHMNNPVAIDPKLMLATANKVVCSENLGKYLTMIYMVYDKKLSKLSYSIAGHYPFPIYIEENQNAQYIGERGYPIGMFAEASYESYQLDLSNNFKLAIFTDGLMEVRPEVDLSAKETSILNILTKHHDKDIQSIKQYLAIDPDATLPDDITGLFVSRR